MNIQILSRLDGKVIFEVEAGSIKAALEIGVSRGVSFQYARLDGASLDGASLDGASLDGASLAPIRDDFFAVLSQAPAEVPALIEALATGRVNGSTYSDGECGCLIGTLAIASGIDPKQKFLCGAVHDLRGNSDRPAEVFFLAIKKGDTPETSQFAKLAHDWAGEWRERMQQAFSAQPAAGNG